MQSSPSAQFIATIGAVTAALIAGFFSYLNLVSAKEQKISEFRQAWIDDLRDAICRYIASVSYLASLYKVYSEIKDAKKERFEMLESIRETYEKVNESYNSIVLRVNDQETDIEGKALNEAFLKVLSDTREQFSKNNYADTRATTFKLRDVAKPLLKYEWKRVKAGEPSYQEAKKKAGITLAVGLIFAVIGGGSIAYKTFFNTTESEEKSTPQKNNSLGFKSNTSLPTNTPKKPTHR